VKIFALPYVVGHSNERAPKASFEGFVDVLGCLLF